MEAAEHTSPRTKSFTFKTSTTWTDSRSGSLASEGKPAFRVSSPPEFKGERGVWTPEDLFVGAVETCHMTTFLAFAAQRKLPIHSYKSHANGVLEFIDGDFRFTRIVIFPTITVGSSVAETDVHLLLREAEKHCLVANSIASIVEVNPTIIVQPG
jgi:organic hydroperoxide reductase OsmC/OhrA